jgi:hypothetical protein
MQKGALTALAFIGAAGLASAASAATLAPTSGTQGKDLHITDMRNMPFCEIEVLAGFPPMFNFENTTGASDCPPDKFDAIDTKELTKTIGAEWIALNPRDGDRRTRARNHRQTDRERWPRPSPRESQPSRASRRLDQSIA